jgi:hypothetical protein
MPVTSGIETRMAQSDMLASLLTTEENRIFMRFSLLE